MLQLFAIFLYPWEIAGLFDSGKSFPSNPNAGRHLFAVLTGKFRLFAAETHRKRRRFSSLLSWHGACFSNFHNGVLVKQVRYLKNR